MGAEEKVTNNVVDFAAAKLERSPHIAGMCRCLSCKYEWVQVTEWVANGCIWLECPSCKRMTGRYINHFGWQDGLVLVCDCGNDLFVIYKGGQIFCPSCGSTRHCDEIERDV